jgi:hypothetical protein
MKVEMKESVPLRWPEGWSRTLIEQRKNQAAWKKPYSFYRDAVHRELERMGVSAIEITRNEQSKERVDPGVSVWFSMKPTEDFTWQLGLQLDNPMPTVSDIDAAYRRLVQKHHPDRIEMGSGGDINMYHKLTEFRRKARAWVLGADVVTKHDNCIPCDRFADARQNMAAVASALRHFRGLERVGIPAILERVMSSAFKTALPTGARDEQPIVA